MGTATRSGGRSAGSGAGGRRKPSGTSPATGTSGRKALSLWRLVGAKLKQQDLERHLQGLYAQLGRSYFDHLRPGRNAPARVRNEVGELVEQIDALRRRTLQVEREARRHVMEQARRPSGIRNR